VPTPSPRKGPVPQATQNVEKGGIKLTEERLKDGKRKRDRESAPGPERIDMGLRGGTRPRERRRGGARKGEREVNTGGHQRPRSRGWDTQGTKGGRRGDREENHLMRPSEPDVRKAGKSELGR